MKAKGKTPVSIEPTKLAHANKVQADEILSLRKLVENLTEERNQYSSGYAKQRERVEHLNAECAQLKQAIDSSAERESLLIDRNRLRSLLDWTIQELERCHTASYANHIMNTLKEAMASRDGSTG